MVFITNRLPKAAYQKLSKNFKVTWNKSQLSEKQLLSKVKPYHALLTTLADPITASVLRSSPNLQCVANYAVGYNNIDLAAAKKKQIWVTNTPDVLTEATADIAWALILACARRIPEGERLVRNGKFKGWNPLMLLGVDVNKKNLGIFGMGRIGKAVARRGRGWGMRVIYHQRHRESRVVENRLNATFVSFSDLLKRSDILSVHSPLTSETSHRFTLVEFKKMKRTAIFVNTSRGAVHSEKDLAMALKRGLIFSAGLDVYEFEPKIDADLLKAQNCTLLPHLGSGTVETRDRMAILAAENIELVLRGHTPKTPVFNFK